MPIQLWLIAAVAALAAFGFASRAVLRNPRGDVETGLFLALVSPYCRLVHRLRVDGKAHIPQSRTPGPLIVVANHTAGVDPVLIQAACPFEIRWIMAEDMRVPQLQWLWTWGRIIFVDRSRGNEVRATRTAIEHLKSGGVLGIFPEGHLERPPKQIRPFLRGLSLIVRKTGAPVLPFVIDGTPTGDPAWSSLWRTSRSTLTAKPAINYADEDLAHLDPADDLRERFMQWTGWPANDRKPPAPGNASGEK